MIEPLLTIFQTSNPHSQAHRINDNHLREWSRWYLLSNNDNTAKRVVMRASKIPQNERDYLIELFSKHLKDKY